MGKRAYHFDGIDVLPVEDFLKRLHHGDVFQEKGFIRDEEDLLALGIHPAIRIRIL